MEKLFEDYLTNGLSEYDAKYLSTYKYVMLLSKNKNITAYFANLDYIYFVVNCINVYIYKGITLWNATS